MARKRRKAATSDPNGAEFMIGDDPEPSDGWLRFNGDGERVDAEGHLIDADGKRMDAKKNGPGLCRVRPRMP